LLRIGLQQRQRIRPEHGAIEVKEHIH
jgi:hypothetical protein